MPEYDSTIEYRDIRDFPGYKVGSDGSLWTSWVRGARPVRIGHKWHQMKPMIHPYGYPLVIIGRGRNKRQRPMHIWVLETFIGSCPDGMECRHLDGDPANNNLLNLCWGTPAENQADRITHGTHRCGEQLPWSKLTEANVREIRAEYATGIISQKQIGEKYGVCQHTISRLLLKKTWKHV